MECSRQYARYVVVHRTIGQSRVLIHIHIFGSFFRLSIGGRGTSALFLIRLFYRITPRYRTLRVGEYMLCCSDHLRFSPTAAGLAFFPTVSPCGSSFTFGRPSRIRAQRNLAESSGIWRRQYRFRQRRSGHLVNLDLITVTLTSSIIVQGLKWGLGAEALARRMPARSPALCCLVSLECFLSTVCLFLLSLSRSFQSVL